MLITHTVMHLITIEEGITADWILGAKSNGLALARIAFLSCNNLIE